MKRSNLSKQYNILVILNQMNGGMDGNLQIVIG